MDDRAEQCKRDYNAIQSDIHRIEVTDVATASETVRELRDNLNRVMNEFSAATRMSNIGSTQFVDALTKIIQRLDSIENYFGNINI